MSRRGSGRICVCCAVYGQTIGSIHFAWYSHTQTYISIYFRKLPDFISLHDFLSEAEKVLPWFECQMHRRRLTWAYLANEKINPNFIWDSGASLQFRSAFQKLVVSLWCAWNGTSSVSGWCHLFIVTIQYLNNAMEKKNPEIAQKENHQPENPSNEHTWWLRLSLYLCLIPFLNLISWVKLFLYHHYQIKTWYDDCKK